MQLPMLNVPIALIFGGNGKTARYLTEMLRSTDIPYTVFSIIRNPDQIPDLEEIGANPIVQDISTSSETDFIRIMEHTQPDVVIWAAGGKDAKSAEAVDRDGAIKAINALAKAAVTAKRYITISALDVRDRSERPVPDWYSEEDKQLSDRMWGIIGPVMRAKLEADKELRVGNAARKLDYTIVRPGGLTGEEGTGRARAGKVGVVGTIPRQDVARVIYAAMQNKQTSGLAFDVLGQPENHGSTIEEAVSQVAGRHEDCFEGYY